ncbi:MAG: methionine ABC transporter permease [Anaerotignum sp.]
MSFLYKIAPNLEYLGQELIKCMFQTFHMLFISGSIAFVLGLALGSVLIVTKKGGILQNVFIYKLFDKAIDIIRSVPFIILMVLLIPLSRLIVGTGSGLEGSYVALVAGTVPFFARQVETVLSDVDKGLIEASEAMGFSPMEIVFSVYLKESIPGITRVTMITFVSLIGITAIAGAIGAGGLGDFAIRYGYQMGYRDMIWVTTIIILLLISVIQFIGNIIIRKTTH